MNLRVFQLLAIIALVACSGAAATLQSDFTSGDDGWTLGELFSAHREGSPAFVPTGGVSGGYIEAEDVHGYNAFHAPLSWLGDRSFWYGSSLSLHQRALTSDGVDYPLLVIGGGGLLLQYRTTPPMLDWTAYTVPFLADGTWEVGNGSGNPGTEATEEQLQQALANVQWLSINADWFTGPDTVGLDSVGVTWEQQDPDDPSAVPEPSVGILSAAGLLGLMVYRRRLR